MVKTIVGSNPTPRISPPTRPFRTFKPAQVILRLVEKPRDRLAFFRRASEEKTGWMAGLIVLAACVIVNVAFWWPLQFPPRWIGSAVGIFAPTSCAQYATGSWKYDLCGWGLAAFALSGTFVIAGLLFAFRAAIRRAIHRVVKALPPEMAFLWPPALATLFVTMAWASIPFHAFTRKGLVWDGFFPTLVGILTWALLRYRRPAFRIVPRLLARRDRLPEWVKYALAFGLVGLAAWAVTKWLTPPPFLPAKWYEMNPPARDQLLALVSLLVTFLLWAPRVRVARPRGETA